MNCWEDLTIQNNDLIFEIKNALNKLEIHITDDLYRRPKIANGEQTYSIRLFHSELKIRMKKNGWNTDILFKEIKGNKATTIGIVDYEKNGIGVDLGLSKRQFIESKLFLRLPFLINSKKINKLLILLPSKKLNKKIAAPLGDFDYFLTTLKDNSAFPIKVPFALIEIGEEKESINVISLLTEIDKYLISIFSKSLNEIITIGENDNFEFKEILPDNKKVAHEVCGFANSNDGGLILIGLSDSGQIIGIDESQSDDIQLKITNIISTSCIPTPQFQIKTFKLKETNKIIMTVLIYELKEKPCMTYDKVYLRKGPSVRPCNSSEIRRMIIK